MANKTLEDLAKQVIDSQQGLMSVEDLQVFFDDPPPAPVKPDQTPVEPDPAPSPQAPAATPDPIAEPVEPDPVVSQPDFLNFLPEKFRDKDANSSIEKMAKSYAELEAELQKERDEKSKLDGMLRSFSEPVPQTSNDPSVGLEVTPQVQTADDVTDSSFFDSPVESSRRVAAQVAQALLGAYHTASQEATKRTQYVENFKAMHADFNEYKEDMAAILKARPDLDKKVESLPFVYELAKQRHKSRLEKIRKELGINEIPKSAPATTPAVAAPQLSEAELIEKAKAAIIAEIKKRKGASGIAGGTPPTSPDVRAHQVPKEQPMTEGDKIFADMLAAGRNTMSLEL